MKKWQVLLVSALSVLTIAGCGNKTDKANRVTVGVAGENEEKVWNDVSKKLKDDGIDLKVKLFSDYVQPNAAVAENEIDMNAFQHVAYLSDYDQKNKKDLVPIGYTYISAMVAYSEKVKDLKDLKDGATVVIPNDPTNGGRALLLLQQAGLLKLDKEAGITPTVQNITENSKNLKIVEVDAAQVPSKLKDADAVVANTNYAVSAGLKIKDGIFSDTDDLSKLGTQYKNVIAVKAENKDKELYKKVVKAYQSAETEAKIKEVSGGADQKAWTDKDDTLKEFEDVRQKK